MMRGIMVLSRAGTVLIAVDLALILVSILPSSGPLTYTWNVPVGPEMFQPAYPIQLVTPQQSLRVNVTIQGTMDVLLLQLNVDTLAAGTTNSSAQSLQSFLQANPQSRIFSQRATNQSLVLPDYVPLEVTNVTLVLSNPTQITAKSIGSFALSESLAPEARVRTLAGWTLPLGLVATLPWLAETRKKKKRT